MKRLIPVGILLIVGLIVVYGAVVVWGTFELMASPYKIPDSEEAPYSVTIKNTGLTYFTNAVEETENIVLMRGFWELAPDGEKFKYREDSYLIVKAKFGPVTVKKRQ